MTTSTIPITEILIEDRQRIDHSDTDGLKDSIKLLGVIQPLILEELSRSHPLFGTFRYRLVAGGRRLTFLKELGHTLLYHGTSYDVLRPGFVFGRELSKDEMHELELEENLRRKEMSWQEKSLAIANLYRLKIVREAEKGRSWTQKMMGAMLGCDQARVSYTLQIAEELKNPASPLWKMDGPIDALRYFDEKELNRVLAELAKRSQATAAITIEDDEFAFIEEVEKKELSEKDAAKDRYLSNPHNNPEKFEEYWTEKQKELNKAPRVALSPRLFKGDCLSYMKERIGRFDHIITDPPYAIDMDNLDQHGLGLSNIDSVRAAHQVGENLTLLQKFASAAFNSLKDIGFLIMWCDQDVWATLKGYMENVGFKVQRWPIVWVKSYPCMNSIAQYNFTKTTEIAMVCRKGNATLCRPGPSGHMIEGTDEYKQKMSHPFVKPFNCWRHLVEAVSMEGQHILDPFAGHGSGPLSFLRLNRSFFACESNEEHFNHLQENLRQYYLRLDPRTEFI